MTQGQPRNNMSGRFVAKTRTKFLSCTVAGCNFTYSPDDADDEEFAQDMGCPTHGTGRDLEEHR